MKAPPLSAQVVFRRVILRTQLLLTQPRTRSQGHLRCALLFFFQAEDGIRDRTVTGVQTCALPISRRRSSVRLRTAPPRWLGTRLYEHAAVSRLGPRRLSTPGRALSRELLRRRLARNARRLLAPPRAGRAGSYAGSPCPRTPALHGGWRTACRDARRKLVAGRARGFLELVARFLDSARRLSLARSRVRPPALRSASPRRPRGLARAEPRTVRGGGPARASPLVRSARRHGAPRPALRGDRLDRDLRLQLEQVFR